MSDVIHYDCTHPGCGAVVPARRGGEEGAAAFHARRARHPKVELRARPRSPSTLPAGQGRAARDSAHGAPSGQRTVIGDGFGRMTYRKALILILAVAVVWSVVSALSGAEKEDPLNDRQRCEQNSPDDDVISFDDCKGMFPDQTGLSGWD